MQRHGKSCAAGGHTLAEVARHFGLHCAAAMRAVRRMAERVPSAGPDPLASLALG